MLPGPTYIRKCPECGGAIEQQTYPSGGLFGGGSSWTDGKLGSLSLVLCPHCHAPLWIAGLEILDRRPYFSRPPQHLNAKPFRAPSMDDYLELLDRLQKGEWTGDAAPHPNSGLWVHGPNAGPKSPHTTSPGQKRIVPLERDALSVERYLRIRVWWAGNDQRRGNARQVPLSEKERTNLEALVLMLESKPRPAWPFSKWAFSKIPDPDLLTKVEAVRELGRFDEALGLLDKLPERELSEAARVIEDLARAKDPYVALISPFSWKRPYSSTATQ